MITVSTNFWQMFYLCINQVAGFYQQNVTLPQVFFKHFASKLPGFQIGGILVENGLNIKELLVTSIIHSSYTSSRGILI